MSSAEEDAEAMSRTLTDLVARGCLPIGLSTARDSVVFAPLAELSRREPCLLEPFFTDAVDAYRGGEFYAVAIGGFAERVAQLDVVAAPGVIAHTSRCGSTLLANLLALRSQSLVLKEPGFLNEAVTRVIRTTNAEDRHAASELVRGLVRYAGAVAQAYSRELVIKLTSWTAPVVARILAPCDQDRWLLLWRDPVEVVASLMAMGPGWWRNAQVRADVLAVLISTGNGSDVSAPDPAEFYARVWHAVVEPFVLRPADGPTAGFGVLEYAALRDDPPAAFRAVEAWLALSGDGASPAGFGQAQSRYSKASGAVPFDPAGTHRRPPLSPQDQATVQRITGELVGRLRASGDGVG